MEHGLEEQCSCTDEAVLPEDDSWVWASRDYGGPNGKPTRGYVPQSFVADFDGID